MGKAAGQPSGQEGPTEVSHSWMRLEAVLLVWVELHAMLHDWVVSLVRFPLGKATGCVQQLGKAIGWAGLQGRAAG